VWKFRKNLFKDAKTYLGEKKIKLEAKDVVPNINPHSQKLRFLSMATLIFDLDIQTRPNEGPNMSSL